MAGRGSNSVQLRHYNERVVLNALRRFGQASKAEIARFAHLTPPAVATIVEALEQGGFVKGGGRRFGGKGQPASMYELSPNGAYSIGLHIGRRALDAVLIDFRCQTQAYETHDHDHPDPVVVRRIARCDPSALSRQPRPRRRHGWSASGCQRLTSSADGIASSVFRRRSARRGDESTSHRTFSILAACRCRSKTTRPPPPWPNSCKASARGTRISCIFP